MALVSLRQVLDHAAENDYAIPAFNVNNLEQILAILDAASETDSPVILQISNGARKYAKDEILKHMIFGALQEYSHLPVVVHQDHSPSINVCVKAIQLGFSSIMMDGSLLSDGKTPSDYFYNVDITRKAVDMAHNLGISVEGELGCLGSLETGSGEKEDGHGFEGTLDKKSLLTDPDQAVDFVNNTKVDALAIAIGTSHGAYKFSRQPTENILAIDLVKLIHEKIPNTHLVMHGSSSVPQDVLKILREQGGDFKDTYGVPVKEIQSVIKYGVRKVNIDTDIRLAMTAAVRLYLNNNRSHFDPRQYLSAAKDAATSLCKERFISFGCQGMASKIKPISLNDMVKYY